MVASWHKKTNGIQMFPTTPTTTRTTKMAMKPLQEKKLSPKVDMMRSKKAKRTSSLTRSISVGTSIPTTP
ncbi:hypothetical protein RvY_17953 [Ramazzottius varieornatus]|uniref:Uncharacterized protein n=1 Tax=Ramazzottius varieornatus TaxID=947166 RepID=A0A1D1WAE5_RAMVA|nr:hypothetical protein RvY_17953 [Ramazzottius varieornatus]